MYYRLCEHIGLRSWKRAPYACYVKKEAFAKRLSKDDYELLCLCDGAHDLPGSDRLKRLEEEGFVVPCRKGDLPDEWSLPRRYDNRYFPKMNLMITGKCNYNCRHCFNAADNAPLMAEWAFEPLLGLLDQARDCGIHAFTITGGEPMLHPRFMDILGEIIRRDMFVEELNTNGFFITADVLSQMKSMGCRPLMKISFDGIGCHDWMRAAKGTEERTLSAIRRCVQNRFPVMVQMQVNKKNLESLLPSLDMLEQEGVRSVRLIRTTESGRWRLNHGDEILSFPEYYEQMLALAERYCKNEHRMDIDIWQFLHVYPAERSFSIGPVQQSGGMYRGSAPVCRGNRGMVAVTAEGDLVPCLQLSGYYKLYGLKLGNLHDTALKDLLTESSYLDTVCATVDQLKNGNAECASCEHFRYCCGGCRAIGIMLSGVKYDKFGTDRSKCRFFKDGWYEKTTLALRGWKNLTAVHCGKAADQGENGWNDLTAGHHRTAGGVRGFYCCF
ncbi:MAG: radical SAM protein [Lachnospiraceae bacterium]|nr:radical SAM protein [Lachnospiraceae bacterium]